MIFTCSVSTFSDILIIDQVIGLGLALAMVHIQAGVFLAIFCMAEISIFVDESGHFDMHSKVSPYYIVSFIFHNQSDSIEENLQAMDVHIHNLWISRALYSYRTNNSLRRSI